MTDTHTFLERYESIAAASAQMLAAARAADWDRLIAAEDVCRGVVAELRAAGPAPSLDPEADRRRKAIIRTVLANDAAIRDLAQPRLAELARLLNLCVAERQVCEA